jgi:hypothetical protein
MTVDGGDVGAIDDDCYSRIKSGMANNDYLMDDKYTFKMVCVVAI